MDVPPTTLSSVHTAPQAPLSVSPPPSPAASIDEYQAAPQGQTPATAASSRPPSPRSQANTRLAAAGPPPALVPTAYDLALQAQDVVTDGRVSTAFSKHPFNAFARERGRALALREKYGAPLSKSEQHDLSMIRVIRAIDAAEDSKACIEASIAQQEQSIMAPLLTSSLAMNRQFVRAQEETIAQESAYLLSLLRRA